jgi:hypothetical protein
MVKQKAPDVKVMTPLEKRIRGDQGGGLSHDFADNAFWFSDPTESAPPHDAGPPPKVKPKAKKYDAVLLSPEDLAWLTALDQLDRLGDEKPLQQLQKVCDPSPRIKKYLADQIERNKARKGKSRGRPRTPAYSLSRKDALLLMAAECVKAYRQRGLSVSAALDKVRDEWSWVPINRTTLAAVHNGCHASLNRHWKRIQHP